jgi:hypothetical protein
MEAAAPAERRNTARRTLRCAMTLRLQNGQILPARCLDLGEDGLSCTTDHPLPAGTPCLLTFALTVGNTRQPLNAVARVVYAVCRGMEGFRLGLRFTELQQAQREAIARFLSQG